MTTNKEKSMNRFMEFARVSGWQPSMVTATAVALVRPGASTVIGAEWYDQDDIVLRAASPFDEQMFHRSNSSSWNFDAEEFGGFMNAIAERDRKINFPEAAR